MVKFHAEVWRKGVSPKYSSLQVTLTLTPGPNKAPPTELLPWEEEGTHGSERSSHVRTRCSLNSAPTAQRKRMQSLTKPGPHLCLGPLVQCFYL